MNIDKLNLECLWCESEDGASKVPVGPNGEMPPVETHPYCLSRFPLRIRTEIYKRRADGLYGAEDRLGSFGGSFSEPLALAMVDGANNQKSYRLMHAMIIASEACERCMNSLAYEYGLGWGYAEGSEEWLDCPSECEMCREILT